MRVGKVGFVLEDRQRSRTVDHDVSVVLDHVTRVFPTESGDGSVGGLRHVLDDRVVLKFRARVLGGLDQEPAVLQPVDDREFAGDGNVEDGVLLRDLEAAVVDAGIGERISDLRFRDRLREGVGTL